MAPIRVLIADDHRLFREGLSQICELIGGFQVVGQAENGQVAVKLARELQPDVVLMDVQMPVLDGVQATRLVVENNPSTRVIMLTMYRQDEYVFEAIKAGAAGYLLKDTDANALVEAVRAAHRGEALVDPGVAGHVLEEFRRISRAAPSVGDGEYLTGAEMDILRLVARGADNKDIARQLSLTEKTVTNRLSDIYQKLHVANRTQAALLALRRGWANLDD